MRATGGQNEQIICSPDKISHISHFRNVNMIAGEIVLAYPRTIKILKKGIRLGWVLFLFHKKELNKDESATKDQQTDHGPEVTWGNGESKHSAIFFRETGQGLHQMDPVGGTSQPGW